MRWDGVEFIQLSEINLCNCFSDESYYRIRFFRNKRKYKVHLIRILYFRTNAPFSFRKTAKPFILGLNDPEVFIDFVCLACGCIDPMPEFMIGEFSYGLKKGEEVEMFCPKCNGKIKVH